MPLQAPMCLPFKTVTDLSTKQYLFMKATATGSVVDTCAAITDIAVGILQDDPVGTAAVPQPASVAVFGTSKLIAGAAIAVGASVAPTAAGKGQTTVATQFGRAVALDSAGADGDMIEVLLLSTCVKA